MPERHRSGKQPEKPKGLQDIKLEKTDTAQSGFDRMMATTNAELEAWDTFTRDEIGKARAVIRNEMVKPHHKTPLENPKQ